MPRSIFEIDELLRPVIDELVGTSPRTAVSFALTRRSHEEPMLSSLWKQQSSLTTPVKALPQLIWIGEEGHFVSGCEPPHVMSCNHSPRRLKTIPCRKTGTGCTDTLLECANWTSRRRIFPTTPSLGSGVIHLIGCCARSWNSWTGKSTSHTLALLQPFLPSLFESSRFQHPSHSP